MASANTWINEVRTEAGKLLTALDTIQNLQDTAIRNGKAYNLREPGNPSDAIELKIKHWMEQTAAPGPFPAPTADDLWAAALVFKKINDALDENDRELLAWVVV
jgi:hypothetical protein